MIRERGPLPADQVRSVLGQCALALGVAHEAKVVHRDVKPANILIRADGLVKLTDFGIARAADASGHTRAGDLLGTPSYLSPEQALGRPATGASDLYALGVVGHEMLSGTKPFDKPTPIATAMSHIHEAPPPLPDDVPEVLAGVIEDLLAKDPLDRPDNARAVAYRLGLADQEMAGLAIGLAHAVYGESTLNDDVRAMGTVCATSGACADDRRRCGVTARGLRTPRRAGHVGPLRGTPGKGWARCRRRSPPAAPRGHGRRGRHDPRGGPSAPARGGR